MLCVGVEAIWYFQGKFVVFVHTARSYRGYFSFLEYWTATIYMLERVFSFSGACIRFSLRVWIHGHRCRKEMLLKDRVKGTHCFNSSNLFKVATAPESVMKTRTSLLRKSFRLFSVG
jgi:hypothetical protein